MAFDKILFIDESYHKQTKSTLFFEEIFSRKYGIEHCYIQGMPIREIKRIADADFAAVIFFQVSPAPYINYFNRHNVVFVPMYDSFAPIRKKELVFLKGIKWVFFSGAYRAIEPKDSLFVKYFPEPGKGLTAANEESFFFWQRRERPSWEHAKALISKLVVDRVHMHCAVDPPFELVMPSQTDIDKYHVTFSRWLDKKDDIDSIIMSCKYYFAPRTKEGIGMSYLEAMAQGRIVIAPNDGTMNEYIVHGVNGYLYDIENARPLELVEGNLAENAYRTVRAGREEWLMDKEKILSFVEGKRTRRFYPCNINSIRNIRSFFRRQAR
jgi:glycosyltransferase involved in cell wall biosynthesis